MSTVRKVTLQEESGPDCISDVVIQVGNGICRLDNLAFQSGRNSPALGENILTGLARFGDGIERVLRQVQASATALQAIEDPDRVQIVAEALRKTFRQRLLTGMPEGAVSDVVSERDGLSEILIEIERSSHCSCDPGDLERVCKARHVVIADRSDEDLSLVGEAPERFRLEDSFAVHLKGGPKAISRLCDATGGDPGTGREAAEPGLSIEQASRYGLIGEQAPSHSGDGRGIEADVHESPC